ncbi:MAG: hypothetical protein Q9M44_00580, partial [Ghiorsea sp.]|nr:hypothetical protein [Ghiorsea sp.]
AIDFTSLLESHARRVYAMGELSEVDSANKILDMVEDGRLSNPFARGDLLRKKISGLRDAKDVDKTIGLLVSYGWGRLETKQTGGRPSELCHVFQKQ